jgi:isopentenyl diphosphate isomerase/L-lactate dehydrogenase-like FMN-dependent dehydrogenase
MHYASNRYDPATFEVYLDGGVRRGTDIFKAIALGCTAVGIGTVCCTFPWIPERTP